MEVKNGEIYNSVEPLGKLIGMGLPVETSLQIVTLVQKLEEKLQAIDIVKQGLIKTYGISFKADGAGNTTIKSKVKGDVIKYIAEVNKLTNLGTEVDIATIKLPRQVDGKPLVIEPSILIALQKFIDVE